MNDNPKKFYAGKYQAKKTNNPGIFRCIYLSPKMVDNGDKYMHQNMRELLAFFV